MKWYIFAESLKIRQKESILLGIQCILMFVLIISIFNISSVSDRKVKQLNQTTASLNKLTDNFILEEERKFFSQSDNVSLLKKFYEWEKSNTMWMYIIASRQNVGFEDKILDEVFEYGYEGMHRTEGTYKSIQINDNFLEHFSINICEGRKFSQEDYRYDGCLSLLLGNAYQDIFNLNEKVELYYLGIKFNCEIIGFLDKNSYYNNGYDLQLLDYYVMLPSIEEFNSATISANERKRFELKLYLDKCSGYILSKENNSLLQKYISEKCYELDFVPYSILGLTNYYPAMWGIAGNELGKLLGYFAILIVMNSVLCISVNMAAKISSLIKVYAIYIMNGVKKTDLIGVIAGEIFFVVLISEVLAAFLSYLYWGQVPTGKLVLCYFIVCILSTIYPWQMLKRAKLSLIINEEENI